MKELTFLFGSKVRVPLMRIFLLSQGKKMAIDELKAKLMVPTKTIRSELKVLEKAGFIKKMPGRVGSKAHWKHNLNFKYNESLKQLLLQTELFDHKEILSRVSKVGSMQLVLVSGIFLPNLDEEARVDLLLVGKKIDNAKLRRVIRNFEAELGGEVRYTALSVDDFKYRLGVNDRLLRDIFDGRHEVILNRGDILRLK